MRQYHTYRPTPFVVTAGAALLMSMILQGCTPASTVDPNQSSSQVTISGRTECLPHKDTSGPQTMECAFGLQAASDGKHYALDTANADGDDFETGKNATIDGLFIPLIAISSDQWMKYDIVGIVQVQSLTYQQ